MEVTDPAIRADAITPIGGETITPLFDAVSIQMPIFVRGPAASQVRMQAIAEQLIDEGSGETDRLPEERGQGLPLLIEPPRFPVCSTVPPQPAQRGAEVTVEANDLLPREMAKVFLGDGMVATGQTDENGDTRVDFVIPEETEEGDRLLTVGVVGTALTADCFVTVVGGPVVCGDGVLGPGEACDDGNTVSGDACSSTCDNQPPDCSAQSANPETLWPPDHQLVDVSVEGVTDPDGDPVAIEITEVSQDEPLKRRGTGNRCPDAEGVGTPRVALRADRAGSVLVPGDGRVYHVGFRAEDGQGGECTGTLTVCVPHDIGTGGTCTDQGQLFDSTGPCN